MVASRAADLLESLAGRDGADRDDSAEGVGRAAGVEGLNEPLGRTTVRRSVRTGRRQVPNNLVERIRSTPAWVRSALVVIAAVIAGVLLWSNSEKVSRPLPLEERMPTASPANGPVEDQGQGPRVAEQTVPKAGPSDAQSSDPRGGSEAERLTVHVAGAVTSPGVVALDGSSRVVDAVAAAGGMRADADPDRINLAASLTDGVRIVVPVKGQPIPDEIPVAPAPGSDASGDGVGDVVGGVGSGRLVNINSATASELEELPGIGPATSAAIIAKRERDGPFRSIDSLLDVRGIGEAKMEGLRDLVTLG